ncbi:TOBE domain-containing protein [Sphaerotilus sulfidivorans]|uniref:TOBE domain-containing protein n=1 Tax=Sphaerotilus sp. FB-3 TaxID=2913396 RepID=UPI00203B4DC0|nr:TOBE domain-containing protein [Sphaerotilus sp. FB-3]GKQ58658.1 transcriptional regulator [Sphaerotilus sp. FB-3]
MNPSDPAGPSSLTGRLTLQTPLGAVLSESRIRLLEAIDRCGSLNRAAREVPLSYKAAWEALDTMNRLAPEPLVERLTGGRGGGGTRLTGYARQLVRLHRAMESSQQDILDRIGPVPDDVDAPTLRGLIRRLGMRSSARNQFATRVTALSERGGLVDVRLQLGDAEAAASGPTLLATITPESAELLGLAPGREVWALVKAPAVRLVVRPARRPPPGRNQLAGRVVQLRPGTTRTAVTLDLGGGEALHAAVPAQAAAALQPGDAAWAVFDGDQVVLLTFG